MASLLLIEAHQACIEPATHLLLILLTYADDGNDENRGDVDQKDPQLR